MCFSCYINAHSFDIEFDSLIRREHSNRHIFSCCLLSLCYYCPCYFWGNAVWKCSVYCHQGHRHFEALPHHRAWKICFLQSVNDGGGIELTASQYCDQWFSIDMAGNHRINCNYITATSKNPHDLHSMFPSIHPSIYLSIMCTLLWCIYKLFPTDSFIWDLRYLRVNKSICKENTWEKHSSLC